MNCFFVFTDGTVHTYVSIPAKKMDAKPDKTDDVEEEDSSSKVSIADYLKSPKPSELPLLPKANMEKVEDADEPTYQELMERKKKVLEEQKLLDAELERLTEALKKQKEKK